MRDKCVLGTKLNNHKEGGREGGGGAGVVIKNILQK